MGAELYVLTFTAIRMVKDGIGVQGTIGKGSEVAIHMSRSAALGACWQLAKTNLPEAAGWMHHDALVTPVPRSFKSNGYRMTVTIEEAGHGR